MTSRTQARIVLPDSVSTENGDAAEETLNMMNVETIPSERPENSSALNQNDSLSTNNNVYAYCNRSRTEELVVKRKFPHDRTKDGIDDERSKKRSVEGTRAKKHVRSCRQRKIVIRKRKGRYGSKVNRRRSLRRKLFKMMMKQEKERIETVQILSKRTTEEDEESKEVSPLKTDMPSISLQYEPVAVDKQVEILPKMKNGNRNTRKWTLLLGTSKSCTISKGLQKIPIVAPHTRLNNEPDGFKKRGGWEKWLKEVAGQNGWPSVEARFLCGGGDNEDSDDEEDGITIKSDSGKEFFFKSKKEITSKSIQEKFELYYEPDHVFTIPPRSSDKKPQKKALSKLKDGNTYMLIERNKIPNQKLNALNAAILSEAAYSQQPLEYLRENSKQHSIQKVIGISEHSEQRVILAIAEAKNVKSLLVAYRGTESATDVMADIQIDKTTKSGFEGKFHKGFASRSETVPMKYITQYAKETECKTIITCGHSLGGAVSTIAALDLMKETKCMDINVYNITFGAPFWGDKAALKSCQDQDMTAKILNYANCHDIVPGILNLDHTATVLEKGNINVSGN